MFSICLFLICGDYPNSDLKHYSVQVNFTYVSPLHLLLKVGKLITGSYHNKTIQTAEISVLYWSSRGMFKKSSPWVD